MFKQSGDYETRLAICNAVHDEGAAIDVSGMAHTSFTEPQIAGVGATEDELEGDDVSCSVGHAAFADSAMGRAKKLDDGFVKVLAGDDGEIMGTHILGTEASTLIHEAVVAMRHDLTVNDVADTIHSHPTLSRVVEAAFRDVAGV